MSDAIRLERLHVYLNRVMNDGEIIANPRFNDAGMAKIAKHMRIHPTEVSDMIAELAQHLDSLTEDNVDEPRFTWEDDTFGGMTVRDTQTGDEKYLGVQQANNLQKLLDSGQGTEQEHLQKAMMENVDKTLSADDFGSESSIFNFPWKLNESMGFAAAQFSGFGTHFKMKVISVVDQEGNPSDVNPKSLIKIARRYIDEA